MPLIAVLLTITVTEGPKSLPVVPARHVAAHAPVDYFYRLGRPGTGGAAIRAYILI